MRGLITAGGIKELVRSYHEKKSLLIKASDVVRGKIVKFHIFPMGLNDVGDLLSYSDTSDCYRYEVLSERQVRELKNHPDCLNSEAVNLFCTEVFKMDPFRHEFFRE